MINFLEYAVSLGQTAIVMLAVLIMAEEISRQAAKGWYEGRSKFNFINNTTIGDELITAIGKAFKK